MPLDRSILNARHIVLPAYQQIEFYLVGCGETGSWLAPSLCRIARYLTQRGKNTTLIFIDRDKETLI